jgi:hypothetical protein
LLTRLQQPVRRDAQRGLAGDADHCFVPGVVAAEQDLPAGKAFPTDDAMPTRAPLSSTS